METAEEEPERPERGVHKFAFGKLSVYTGSWRNGLRQGQGTLAYKNGRRWKGLVECACRVASDSCRRCRHGVGWAVTD